MSDSSEIESLLDQKQISAARAEGEQRFRDFTSDQITNIKRRCKTDLFFLSHGPLEYTKITPKTHGSLTNWMQKTRGHNFRLELMPRGHYKSTIITEADSIQMALPNIADVQEFPYCLGPNVKILLAHEVREKAAEFLYNITKAFTRKPLMVALWPECIPNKNEQRINKWELDLPGRDYNRQATFSTIGAGGAAQGAHYNWLKLDDLIGEEARDSVTVMKSILTWFDNILALLTDPTDGFDLTGTRWAYHDVYSHAMEVYKIHPDDQIITCMSEKELKKLAGGLLKIYARGVFEDGLPIFPELMTPERIKILRQNPLIWAAQFANNPLESGMTEFTYKLKFYNVSLSEDIVVFTGDTSFKRERSELDIIVLCDPSMGESKDADESGIIVTGMDSKSNIFILETIKKRLRPPQLVDELFRLHLKYRPRLVAIEEVNFSAIFKYWIEERAEKNEIHLNIRPYKPGSKRSKEARIRGLAHFFSAGQVYVHEGMNDFRDEYEQFPLGKSQHLLDALAQGPDFWKEGDSRKDAEKLDQMLHDIYDERDIQTGY
jgi:predicted phage terminase large subunit-like protein